MKKLLGALLLLVMLASLVFTSCGGGEATTDSGDNGKIVIGLLFSDFATERWPREQALMTQLANDAGADVISQVANNDPQLQNTQIENMILQGVDVMIIIAEDGDAAATAVDQAAKAGIPVIAYDRLIKSANLAAYLTFDNIAVGEAQAQGIIDVVDSGKFVLLGGNPADNNAHMFRQGQMNILQPLIDSGQIEIVADQWVENWDSNVALTKMENILTETGGDFDAVVASNDGTALGALQAMKAQGLAGKVPISGQDATDAGCKSIVDGELTMTVFKDIRNLSPIAIDMAIDLANGKEVSGLEEKTLAELTGDDNLEGTVPCKFLKVVRVDASNVYEEVVLTGFQSWDIVYKDAPADVKAKYPKP